MDPFIIIIFLKKTDSVFIGSHATGGITSFALWVKNENKNELPLFHYSQKFGKTITAKYLFTLILGNGTPILYSSFKESVKAL